MSEAEDLQELGIPELKTRVKELRRHIRDSKKTIRKYKIMGDPESGEITSVEIAVMKARVLEFQDALDAAQDALEDAMEVESAAKAANQSERDNRQTNPRHISRDVRQIVWRRDRGRCINCGSNELLEFDHIIPVAKGGSSTARNIQLLCEPCNREKSANI